MKHSDKIRMVSHQKIFILDFSDTIFLNFKRMFLFNIYN